MRTILIVAILLLSGTAARAQSIFSPTAIEKAYGWTLVANATSHAADVSSTIDCSVRRTCIEKNPWLAPFQSRPTLMGLTKTAVAATKTYMIHRYVWRKGRRKTAIAMIATDTIITGVIAARNTRF